MAKEITVEEGKITVENCNEITTAQTPGLSPNHQSKAWQTVWEYCLQNGMDIKGKTGIEAVIGFIESNTQSPSPVKQ